MSTSHKHDCCSGHDHAHAPHTPASRVVPGASAIAKKAKFVLNLRIEQMDCPTEEGLIRGKLGKMKGVDGLEFNLMSRRLTVQHHLGDPGRIVAAINSLGMEAVIETPIGNATGAVAATGIAIFHIENMDCPTEEALIRSKLGAVSGISGLDFNLMQRKLTVQHSLPDTQSIQQALHAIGMEAVLDAPQTGAQSSAAPATTRKKWLILALAGIAAAGAEVTAWVTGTDSSPVIIALALLAIFLSGTGTYKKGWIAIRNLNLNINALMSIAVTGAVLIGQWPEAAMVMVLFTLAEMLEGMSLDRARKAISSLLSVAPDRATALQPDGTWAEMSTKDIQVGMTLRVAPGARIALDGALTHGMSAVNQAAITGESIPVSKTVGDTVFAGTLNETGSFDYRVTSTQGDSTLARIIRAVEEAQGSRAPTQGFVDRFAKIYTPIVVALAVLLAVVAPLAFGLPWMDWIYKALVFLVIACPCALVVSTPVTIVSGLAAAAKAGILVKGGVYLEEGQHLKSIALDKTGTITQGRPVVTDVIVLSGSEADALRYAAALANRSDHPVSAAINRYWQDTQQGVVTDSVHEFSAIIGQGTKAKIGESWYFLGNHTLMEDLAICNETTEAALNKLEAEGKTAVVVSSASTPLAVIGVADTIRETSRQAIAELHDLGVHTMILSGDNKLTVQAIAKQVGIDEARGNLLPESKLLAVSEALQQYGKVGMVGDGMNDAPALAKASIGFAMGMAGTDTAIETADVALMDDDLRKIPQFIRLSKRVGRVLKQNIALALSIKLVFFVLAFMGVATLWMAVFADMGASLLVVFNGLRLLKAAR